MLTLSVDMDFNISSDINSWTPALLSPTASLRDSVSSAPGGNWLKLGANFDVRPMYMSDEIQLVFDEDDDDVGGTQG